MENKEKTSRFLSLILRHKPESINITLDEHGWGDVDLIVKGISESRPFTKEDLEDIVKTDEKQRYSFNHNHTLIRANQGHSIPVDVELEEKQPPDILYHGTGVKYLTSIEQSGLISKTRLYVHLSLDVGTATQVGKRHGQPIVYRVDAQSMYKDGYKFYQSVNCIWLTESVPFQYLTLMDE